VSVAVGSTNGSTTQDSPTTCWIITLMVRRGISPQGTLFVARARHSFGGTDCKKCSMAGKSSTGSSLSSFRSCGMFLANFQTHFSTNSATLASCDSGKVPLEGKGLTICKSRAKRDLAQAMVNDFMIKKRTQRSPEDRHPSACRKQSQDNHIDESRQILHLRDATLVCLE
jgi:hypothetical protein